MRFYLLLFVGLFLLPTNAQDADEANDIKPSEKVIGPSPDMNIDTFRPGVINVNNDHIENVPAILHENDPLRYLQLLPGIKGGIENLNGLNVRGSNNDQNLILVQGLPLYGAGHFGGFLSILNPLAIEKIQCNKSIFSARYGNRTASVFDINYKTGNNDWEAVNKSNILGTNIAFSGPVNDQVSIAGAFRINWLGLFSTSSAANRFSYYDLSTNITYKPNSRSTWNFFILHSKDLLRLTAKDTNRNDSTGSIRIRKIKFENNYQNLLTGVKFNKHLDLNKQLFAQLGLSRYSYKSNISLHQTNKLNNDSSIADASETGQSLIFDIIGKCEIRNQTSFGNLFYGIDLTQHISIPDAIKVKVIKNGIVKTDTVFGKNNQQFFPEIAVYGELHKTLGTANLIAGLRLWSFMGINKTYVRPEPRISISQQLDNGATVKASAMIANQGVLLLGSASGSLPVNKMFVVSDKIKPSSNTQIAAEYSKNLKSNIQFAAELYYKWMGGVLDLNGTEDLDNNFRYWENLVGQGNGKAYGSEIMLRQSKTNYLWTVSYSLSHSNRTIPDINFGKKYTYRWSRANAFSATGSLNLAFNTWLNVTAIFMSGFHVSAPTSKYVDANGQLIYDFSQRNNYSMPVYKRIDLGFEKRKEKSAWGINVYNVLLFKNPVNFQISDNNSSSPFFGNAYLRFIPSAYYTVKL